MNNNIWKRNETRNVNKFVNRPENKPEDRTENRAEKRAEKRNEIRTENKAEKRNEPRTDNRTGRRNEHRTEKRTEPRTENKDENRNETRTENRPGNRINYGPEKRIEPRTDNKDENRPGNRTEYRNESKYEEKGRRDSRDEANVQETADDAGIIEGRNAVLEALKSDRTFNKILISKGEKEGSIKQVIALAKDKGIIIQEVERTKLDSMSFTHSHQGVIAFASVKDYVELDDILKIAEEKGEPPFIIILDEITDSYNLGSILRTADASGAHGIVIPKRRAVGLNTAVSKASAGAVEHVPVARVTNISQTIEYLKKKNIWVVGTDSSGKKSFYDNDLKGAIALVIGSEGEGIGKLVLEKCDFVVNIPMKGQISSLNAAVAGAIVMYEILKQRTK